MKRLPPGPRGSLFTGNLRAFRRTPLEFLAGLQREFGNCSSFRAANQRIYLVNDPDLIRDVFITRADHFHKGRALQRSKLLLGEGLLTSEEGFHLRQRRLMQPAFGRQRLQGYAQQMIDAALRTRARWHDGQSLDLAQEMHRLTLAIVGRTLFSTDVESEADEVGAAMQDLLGMFSLLMTPFAQLLQRLPLPQVRRFRAAQARLDRIIYGLISARRASGEDTGDLLSMLLLAQDEDGSRMTDRQVRDECLTLFLAGHETTANALSWTWYLLAQHPAVRAQLDAELSTGLQGRTPSPDDYSRLPYTEQVFAESLRLYPPAWAVGRLCIRDIEIGGYYCPVGTLVLICPWVLHRTPDFWDDPDTFDPSRPRSKQAFLPFGAGARICIGERFAWTEGVLLLATIAQHWRFDLAPNARVEPHPLITLRLRHGLPVVAHSKQPMSPPDLT